MADKPALTRYVAQIARIRIETTIVGIKIEADATDDEVHGAMIEEAGDCPRRSSTVADQILFGARPKKKSKT